MGEIYLVNNIMHISILKIDNSDSKSKMVDNSSETHHNH